MDLPRSLRDEPEALEDLELLAFASNSRRWAAAASRLAAVARLACSASSDASWSSTALARAMSTSNSSEETDEDCRGDDAMYSTVCEGESCAAKSMTGNA